MRARRLNERSVERREERFQKAIRRFLVKRWVERLVQIPPDGSSALDYDYGTCQTQFSRQHKFPKLPIFAPFSTKSAQWHTLGERRR